MDIGLSLSRNARRIPNKTAIIYEGETYSYERFNNEVNKLAHGLLKQGVKKGDKIAFMMKNSDKFMIVYYAIMKVGAIAVPVNFRLTINEVAYILDDCDASIVFFDGDYTSLINYATAENEKIYMKVAIDNNAFDDQLAYEEILTDNIIDPNVIVDESDDVEILYTSGTTGYPKGALFDHHRVLHVVFNTSMNMKINPGDNLLHVAPLFHSAQLNLFMVTGTYLGCTQVIHQSFEPEKVLEAIEKYKISIFFSVPTMYNFLLQVPNKEKYDLSSVTRCGYGAAPMPVAVLEQTIELFGTDQFYNMCGQTEGGPGAGIFLLPEEHKYKMGAGGKASLNTEVRVVDDNGNDILPGQVGEFIIQSEMVMKRYYNKPEETKKTLKNGWLYTGDLATIDEDGYITLVDRKKDMIISGGENVYSTEIEQVLYKYPKLLESAVIGLPDPTWGEKVVAIIVPKKGEKIDHQDLKDFCRKFLAGYKVPVEFIEEVEIPRNASGKVLKYKMREALNSGKKINA
ncbi:long-chain-fatty-acid--CoA ligase [Oceanobacillus piezotolerans]|uniref:Long-chain-fatty-acid--CoA ligase n=1 Tax=Oceanobacillus piezotolerans TaxID=2448030 RepID=A0A498D7Z9_9BACI|nr:long-chain fatty acid--CoA ligase [Oceanobacillus piezotolerans]RLL46835.1 long-chain-fatty-acid--CoA ligase [Oceanobacillus piezotolerans]